MCIIKLMIHDEKRFKILYPAKKIDILIRDNTSKICKI
jgi:hypothetical protein